MAEISLSVYQHKLDGLLRDNQFNEVIAHCRHILKSQPKNLKAYSQLGQALFGASRWEEAAEIFRRLLGSLPHDFTAHHSLSQIYEKLGRMDDAIWHAERAFDQQPNNSDVIHQIRRLYHEHRGKDIGRLQLTVGAVAQQHIRNQLFSQAIDVLDKALARYPSRVDLQLLKSRALWRLDKHLDSAELAAEVLDVMPYAMAANRIMTDLWLMEQRPSDAQRYLSRIEDLDPYLAYRLATGEQAPETLVELQELDYQALSRQQLTMTNPDWLNTIGAAESVDDEAVGDEAEDELDALFDDIVDEMVEDEANTPAKVTDDLEGLLDDEWESRVDDLNVGESIVADDDDLDALFGDDDDDLSNLFGDMEDGDDLNLDEIFDDEDDALVEADDELDLDDVFGDDEDEDDLDLPEGVSAEDLPDGLLERIEKMKGASQNDTLPAANRSDIEVTELPGLLDQLTGDDDEDMSWLTDAQQSDFDTDTGDDDEPTDDGESDWLSELESIESSPDAQRASTGLTGMFAEDGNDDDIMDLFADMDDADINTEPDDAINPDDPNAWLKESGIEFDENAEADNPFADDDEETYFESADVDPMAWLDDEDEDDDTADDPQDLDPLAWMNDEDIVIDEDDGEQDEVFDEQEEDDGLTTNDLTGQSPPDIDDDLFGDDEMLDEMLSLEDDLTFDFETEDSQDTSDTDDELVDLFGDEVIADGATDDLIDADDDNNIEFFDDDEAVVAQAVTTDDGQDIMNDDFNWDDEQSDDDNSMDWLNDDNESEEMPDVSDQVEDTSASDDDEVDLEDMFAEMSDDDFESDESGLEWLQADELAESADELDFSIADDDTSEDDVDPLAWMSEDDGEVAGEAGDTDPLAWMSEDGIEIEDDAEDDDPLAWMSEDDGEAVGDGTGMTDMLNALESEEDDFSFQVDSDNVTENFIDNDEDKEEETRGGLLDKFDFSDDTSDVSDGDWSYDEQTANDEAEWLADIEPGNEAEAEASSDIDWLADDLAEADSEDGEETGEEFFNFDAEEDDTNDAFGFDSSPVAAEEPDWLSAIDSTEGEFDDDGDDDNLGDLDDIFGEMSEDDEEGDLEDIEQPDWLSDVSRDEETDDDVAVENTDDWLSDLSEFDDSDDEFIDLEAEDIAEEDESDDWLDTAEDFEEEEPARKSVTGELDWIEQDEEDTDFDAVTQANESSDEEADWLSDLGEFDEESSDDEGEAVEGQLDWMAEDEGFAEETAVGATAEADFLDDVDPTTDESALDWMTDDDDFEEGEEEPQGMTDWLTGDEEDDEPEGVTIDDDSGEWLASIGSYGDDATAMTIEAEDGDDAPDDSQSGEWLASIGSYDGGNNDDSEDDDTDWVAQEQEDVSYDYENDDTLVGAAIGDDALDEPDWLSNMDDGDGVQDAFDEDDSDWEIDSEEFVEEAQATDEPDWLSNMDDGDGVQDAFDEDIEFDIDPNETDDELDVTYEEEDILEFEDEPLYQGETEQSSALDEFEEELEHTPADDAPDWLNAMVPGLDIDYEPEDDDPLDEVLTDDVPSQQTDKGFDWLNDIVDEETGAMAPVVPPPPPPADAPPPRFNFSRLPAWLRKMRGEDISAVASAATVADDDGFNEDDFSFDLDDDQDSTPGANSSNDVHDFDDDDELPDWLDFDDDDD